MPFHRPLPLTVPLLALLAAFVAPLAPAGAEPSPPPTVTPISAVQGGGSASPLVGQQVTVEGIVTSLFTHTGDVLDGFFLQEQDADADADPATSEGVFVFCRALCPTGLGVGDGVTVRGFVEEFFGMTQVSASSSSSSITISSSANPLPMPTPLALPASGSTRDQSTFEPVEGMIVTFTDTLVVSEYFELARYGQIVLTAGSRPYQHTHATSPSADGYRAYLADLATRRIILDDDNNVQNDAIVGGPDEPYAYPEGGLSLDHRFRGGDTITALTGVLHWSFAGQRGTDAWRVRPVPEIYDYTFAPANPRPAEPESAGSDFTVASFNVLNYFTTVDTTSSRTSGPCGPSGGMDCRGADSAVELERQRAKIVAALAAMDADVVGLMEIQNDATSVDDLVAALNAITAPGTYAAIDTGPIGTDAIKVAFIYQAAMARPVGDHAILDSGDDRRFLDDKNRPVLIQTFEEIATGEVLTVAVNHLKSKGSPCDDVGDPDAGDGQGNCNVTRTMAAQALADHLATDPTGSGDPDVLVIGDLNSYRMEDPIAALQAAGYTDLLERFDGDGAYTYVFDGQLGYLDHALSNSALTPQVTGATAWHVNADEPPLFDYNDTIRDAGESSFERESTALPLFAPDPYRSSDHDAVVVGLDLRNALPVADAGGPYEVRVGEGTILDGTGSSDPDGETLTYAWDFDGDGAFDDADEPAPFFSARGRRPGVYEVALQVSDDDGATAVDAAIVRVVTPGRGNDGDPPGRYGG